MSSQKSKSKVELWKSQTMRGTSGYASVVEFVLHTMRKK